MKLPQQIGDYTLLERLGSGSFGTVYRALLDGELGFQQEVAVKILDSGQAAVSPELITSLADEAQLLARASHPHIVAVRRFRRIEHDFLGVVWLMEMELLRGLPLSGVLRRLREEREPMAIEAMLSVLMEACDALVHAHGLLGPDGQSRPVVHRDLKPDNMVVTAGGRLKVLDFGIALAEGRLAGATATGTAKGTPLYMSPEQVRGQRVDGRSDLYSLGAVAYECLTGQTYVVTHDVTDLATLVMRVARADWSSREALLRASLCDAAPRGLGVDAARAEALVRLVANLLAGDVDARPSSAAVLADRLDDIAADWPVNQGRRILRGIVGGSVGGDLGDSQAERPTLKASIAASVAGPVDPEFAATHRPVGASKRPPDDLGDLAGWQTGLAGGGAAATRLMSAGAARGPGKPRRLLVGVAGTLGLMVAVLAVVIGARSPDGGDGAGARAGDRAGDSLGDSVDEAAATADVRLAALEDTGAHPRGGPPEPAPERVDRSVERVAEAGREREATAALQTVPTPLPKPSANPRTGPAAGPGTQPAGKSPTQPTTEPTAAPAAAAPVRAAPSTEPWPTVRHRAPPFVLPGNPLVFTLHVDDDGDRTCTPEVRVRQAGGAWRRAPARPHDGGDWTATLPVAYGGDWDHGAEYFVRCCRAGSCRDVAGTAASPRRIAAPSFSAQ